MSLLFSTGAFASSLSGAAPGMVLLTPTSITHSGTSASIGANGQVTFTAVTSLSLNGVFSADFDNYVVSWRGTVSGLSGVQFRLRASGSDNSTASSYVWQLLWSDSTSVTASRNTQDRARFIAFVNVGDPFSFTASIYGPYLTQPTATRSVTASSTGGASIYDVGATHNQSTSYDGITFFSDSAVTHTGEVAVYGVRS